MNLLDCFRHVASGPSLRVDNGHCLRARNGCCVPSLVNVVKTRGLPLDERHFFNDSQPNDEREGSIQSRAEQTSFHQLYHQRLLL